MFHRLATTAIAALLLTAPAAAQEQTDSTISPHIVSSATMVGIGPANILDTYISQEKFSGTGATLTHQTEWERTGKKWRTVAWHQANIASARDRGKSARELAADYQLYVGRLKWWNINGNLRLGYARSLYGLIGFLYNTSNTNNPAQARLMGRNVNTGLAEWRFTLWGAPLKLNCQIDLPMFGLMFSPNYGQSYYEIFNRGNYDHNICIVSFWRMPSLRSQLSLDIPITGKTTLTVGYLGEFQQTKVNNLNAHYYNHRIMIGFKKRVRIINYRP